MSATIAPRAISTRRKNQTDSKQVENSKEPHLNQSKPIKDEGLLKAVVSKTKKIAEKAKGPKRKQTKQPEEASSEDIPIKLPKRQKLAHAAEIWNEDSIIDVVPLEIVIHIMKFLEMPDIQSLACCSKYFHKISTDDLLWKEMATEKFGSDCIKLVPEGVDWKDFLCKRTSTWKGFGMKSPVNLIQEDYASDPWKTMVSAMLVSRTTGKEIILNTINNFLTIYNSPVHVLRAGKEEMKEFIKPLGLQESRIKAIIQFTTQYFTLKWQEPIECFGIGPMANDSYKLFCKGDFSSVPTDPSLAQYRIWAIKKMKEANDI